MPNRPLDYLFIGVHSSEGDKNMDNFTFLPLGLPKMMRKVWPTMSDEQKQHVMAELCEEESEDELLTAGNFSSKRQVHSSEERIHEQLK
jgi:hypothetical protein